MFHLFNKNRSLDKMREGLSDSALAFEHDIDIELVDMNFEYTQPWAEKIKNREISQEELNFALNTYNNVALSSKFLIQVHKPGRCDYSEYEQMVEKKLQEPLKLTSEG